MAKKKELYTSVLFDNYRTIDNIISFMKDNDIKSMKVSLGKVIRNSDYFFCLADFEVYSRGTNCGKQCPYYEPRNGKSGICKSYGYTFEPAKDYILYSNGELKESKEQK